MICKGFEIVCPDGEKRHLPYHNQADADFDAQLYFDQGCARWDAGKRVPIAECPQGVHTVVPIPFTHTDVVVGNDRGTEPAAICEKCGNPEVALLFPTVYLITKRGGLYPGVSAIFGSKKEATESLGAFQQHANEGETFHVEPWAVLGGSVAASIKPEQSH